MTLVTIPKYYDHFEALQAKSLLADHDIRAVIVGQALTTAIGELPALPLIELQVPASDAPQAALILKNLEP